MLRYNDVLSFEVSENLVIIYKGHPYKDWVTLKFFEGKKGGVISRMPNKKIALPERGWENKPAPNERWVCAIVKEKETFMIVRPLFNVEKIPEIRLYSKCGHMEFVNPPFCFSKSVDYICSECGKRLSEKFRERVGRAPTDSEVLSLRRWGEGYIEEVIEKEKWKKEVEKYRKWYDSLPEKDVVIQKLKQGLVPEVVRMNTFVVYKFPDGTVTKLTSEMHDILDFCNRYTAYEEHAYRRETCPYCNSHLEEKLRSYTCGDIPEGSLKRTDTYHVWICPQCGYDLPIGGDKEVIERKEIAIVKCGDFEIVVERLITVKVIRDVNNHSVIWIIREERSNGKPYGLSRQLMDLENKAIDLITKGR